MRNDLINELKNYIPTHDEGGCVPRFLDLLQSDRCFYRDHFVPGHITASAVLFNPEGDKVLMNHHKFLNIWLGFGGHCDGEEDVLAVAIRETMEESGLHDFTPITSDIIDIDIHPIPANPTKDEPVHDHFDIRFAMRMTSNQRPIISDESNQLQWMDIDEALAHIAKGDSMGRLITKAVNLL